ncbi:hypothetical protein NCC78_20305 [Micromonospora phytophila]|uniref:hypothetical protein n=1 Tax=Micromonospora phytophila TaxID=709888 RepID=UPI002030CD72|nr:hypothetical protein [Micromonospora phytophila]MCM0677012.1 hypothetical protein [Micromonospora phytophila]
MAGRTAASTRVGDPGATTSTTGDGVVPHVGGLLRAFRTPRFASTVGRAVPGPAGCEPVGCPGCGRTRAAVDAAAAPSAAVCEEETYVLVNLRIVGAPA